LGLSARSRADILFSAKIAGPVANLYRIGRDDKLQQLTDNIRWRDLDADISAAGTIVFSSNREPNPHIDLNRRSEKFHLYSTADGNAVAALTSGEGDERMPLFAPGSDSFAFVRRAGERQQLMLLAPGQAPRKLFSAREILDYSWAPDGRRLCVAWRDGSESALRVVNLDGSAGDTLLRGKGDWIVAARWDPQGRRIALVRHPQGRGERRLMLFDPDSGREWQLSPAAAQVQQAPDWSPDGRRLVYAALLGYGYRYDETTQRKLYTGSMQLLQSDTSGETRQLSGGGGLHKAPVYSPDGKQIAFLYAERLDARTLELHTMNADGSGERRRFPEVAQRSGLRWR